MESIRKIIKEHLILEKRIAQISDSLEISFGYDILTSKHARDRSNLGREWISDRVISKQTIIEIIEKCKRKISEFIVNGYIDNELPFVIKDNEFNIHMAVIPQFVEDYYWNLLVKTIFPASDNMGLLVAQDQLVIEV